MSRTATKIGNLRAGWSIISKIRPLSLGSSEMVRCSSAYTDEMVDLQRFQEGGSGHMRIRAETEPSRDAGVW
jgi:hypothetical protein